jgi:hypothetical protein
VAGSLAVRSNFDPKRNTPLLDLGAVRETLAFIRNDLQRVPALERTADLLGMALDEIEAAERRRLAPGLTSILDAGALSRRRH